MANDLGPCETFVADCRIRAVVDIFAHTWDPVVLAALREKPMRRRELRDAIGGISDKVLSDALRRLSGNGLISRRRIAEAPPRVDYMPTDLGHSLLDGPITAMADWAHEHSERLLDPELAEGA